MDMCVLMYSCVRICTWICTYSHTQLSVYTCANCLCLLISRVPWEKHFWQEAGRLQAFSKELAGFTNTFSFYNCLWKLIYLLSWKNSLILLNLALCHALCHAKESTVTLGKEDISLIDYCTLNPCPALTHVLDQLDLMCLIKDSSLLLETRQNSVWWILFFSFLINKNWTSVRWCKNPNIWAPSICKSSFSSDCVIISLYPVQACATSKVIADLKLLLRGYLSINSMETIS